jgi:predicted  nucleic acid-binding Zn-ribbon protein
VYGEGGALDSQLTDSQAIPEWISGGEIIPDSEEEREKLAIKHELEDIAGMHSDFVGSAPETGCKDLECRAHVSALEQRLADVEQRLADVEQHLHGGSAAQHTYSHYEGSEESSDESEVNAVVEYVPGAPSKCIV